MPYNDKKRASNRRWDMANMSRLSVAIRKNDHETIKQAASRAGQSVNAYIVQSIRERMDREQANSDQTAADTMVCTSQQVD